MLNRMRNMVRSWLAKLMIALLVASFAVWGVGDVFINRASQTVATVGDQEVSANVFLNAFQAAVDQASGEGGRLSVAEALERGIDGTVLAELTRRAAVNQATVDLGLSAPDDAVSEAIASLPAFQDAGGRFDPAVYASQIARVGMSQKEFEASVRRDLVRRHLTSAVAAGTAAPEAAYRQYILRGLENRTITYLLIEEDKIEAPAPSEEEAIASYLDENQDNFRTPERRGLTYIWVSPDSLADAESVSDEEAEEYYQSQLDLYSTPATRTLRQIVFETEEEAQEALDRLGEDVSLLTIAGEMGLTETEVDLGEALREDLSETIAEAAFAVTEPGPAGPARTPFGWAALEVVAAAEASERPFDEVREEIAGALALETALDQMPEIIADIEDRRAAGLSLEEIAGEMEIELGVREGLDRFGRDADDALAEGLPQDRAFLEAAFDSLVEEDLDLLEFDDGGIAALRVDAIDESRDQTLDEAREEIVRILEDEAWEAATEAAADSALERVEAGESLEDVAASMELETATSEPFRRRSPDPVLTRDLADDLFRAETGDHLAGKARAPRQALVARLDEITPGDEEEVDGEVETIRPQLRASLGGDILVRFIDHLSEDYGVAVNPASVDAALGLLSESL